MNRLTRDEILHRALDMVDSRSLDAHDRPENTVIVDEAHSVAWLQDGLDYFHHAFPWQGTLKTTTLTLPANSNGPIALPGDFILDVRNGVVLDPTTTTAPRLRRWPVQKYISATAGTTSAGTPRVYTWYGDALYVHPKPATTLTATLWYHALPTELKATQKPTFPSDWVLVEFVRLRGLEWLRAVDPGTARTYAEKEIARLRASGLVGEPEDDELPLDSATYLPGGSDRNAWMGEVGNQG